jgi:hypothetical protein
MLEPGGERSPRSDDDLGCSPIENRALARRGTTDRTALETRFRPQRRAPRNARTFLFIIGPLLWVVSLGVVALVSHHGDSIGTALLVLSISFVASLALLIPLRALRVREERSQ